MVVSHKTEFYKLYVLLKYISHVLPVKEKQVCIIPTQWIVQCQKMDVLN